MMIRYVAVAATLVAPMLVAVAPTAASAEIELSFYGGAQSAPHSDVFVTGDLAYPAKTRVKWEGRSFDPPPYYGVRATYWASERFGYGLDFTHTKVYSSDESREGTPFTTLEFTDGLNTLTANAYRRFDPVGGATPYVGAGIGLAIPHVEVANGTTSTLGYQVTGPAATVLAGVSYPVSDRFAVFGEYKFTYSQNEAELDGGGTLKTDIITNAVNVGVSFNF
ncbi:outer membrane protein [Loktanella sp. DJP18]|uniref:outer membrane protein n=1 Tax=Loktanella sp. DJP18 TaxID=3409788 RepID=UPI003BB71674